VYTKTNLEWDNHRINWHIKSMLADRIVSISGATDTLLESKGYSEKTKKIYLGIDTDKFIKSFSGAALRKELGIADDVFVFGCAAQFVELKNHGILLDAFEMLCERYSNIVLLMCGANHEDAFFDKIRNRVNSSAYTDRMFLLGTLDDMPRFYSALNCFVLPSNNETFGYVYIEAMSCSLPVIGCNIGGPLDIIDAEENGFLVKPSDARGLMNVMEAYLVNRERAAEHGEKGRQKVIDNFSKQVMVRRHMELYLDLGHCG
jgi:glycosyltransferase involved in cell wall biosynthesis